LPPIRNLVRLLIYLLSVAGWVLLFAPAVAYLCSLYPEIQLANTSGSAFQVTILSGFSAVLLALILRTLYIRHEKRVIHQREEIQKAEGKRLEEKRKRLEDERKRLEEERRNNPGRYIIRKNGLLHLYSPTIPSEGERLQDDGHCVIKNIFSREEIRSLKEEILDIFDNTPPDDRPSIVDAETASMYRYQMFNRSALCQRAIENRTILNVIEPLLGNDCHVIANTAWRNPAVQNCAPHGQEWHTDAGPHIPRSPAHEWPEEMPYPIFVIAVHIYLQDCTLNDGPTGVIPGSHKSGQSPPPEERWNDKLTYRNRVGQAHIVEAGDVGMFVSDVWHRRIPPTQASKGRLFLQVNYARRDIAQRLVPAKNINMVSEEAVSRARSLRQLQLIGVHPESFYDG